MLDLTSLPDGHLDPVTVVVEKVLELAPDLPAGQLMLVGAWCRDTMHAALGHSFPTRTTRDVDLALGLHNWDTYIAVADALDTSGETGIQFFVGGIKVDLLPFGPVEAPKGTVVPPTRSEALSVWAFEEIHRHSVSLRLSDHLTCRLPTIPGYTAVKLAAWLDRSAWYEPKDAGDLALSAFWYAESSHVADRLYDSPDGLDAFGAEDADLPRAAARLLGRDVIRLIGPARTAELTARWPGDLDMLVTNFAPGAGQIWPGLPTRRREIIDALTRGLHDPP